MPAGLSPAETFFWTHAGYSWNQKEGETPVQGRLNTARRLAAAEQAASDAGAHYSWTVDDVDSSEWSDEQPAWDQWACTLLSADGEPLASLCGIDFGPDGGPAGEPYARVVEAELALQTFPGRVYTAWVSAEDSGAIWIGTVTAHTREEAAAEAERKAARDRRWSLDRVMCIGIAHAEDGNIIVDYWND